ncbi:hypothetical protein G6F38_003820 [Rhizopus arrhizus]|nr:hypothetical protein G6F38_003820 [Rhizopus arrhizus]
MDRNVTDHKIDTVIDSFELYVEDDSDDDLQPVVTDRKKKVGKILHRVDHKRGSKAKEKLQILKLLLQVVLLSLQQMNLPCSIRSLLMTMILNIAVTILMHLSSKDPFLGEPTKSAFRITKSTSAAVESSTTASKTSLTSLKPSKPVPTAFKSAATSVKTSFYPVSVDKASDIKEDPKKISRRVMIIKTTLHILLPSQSTYIYKNWQQMKILR